MPRSVNTIEEAAELRQRAEELALRHAAPPPADLESALPAWAVEMLHELRVHQIELEMQNEELRRTQAKLEDAHARYFDLYNLAPVGYFTLSESGVILEANLYAASRLGVSRFALVQQPFSRFIFREDQDSFYLHRRKLTEIDSAESWDLRMVRQDGTEFWSHLDAVAAQDSEGSPMLRITMGDISLQKHAEDQQRQLEAELQHAQSPESLGTLTGGIAHDLNNGLDLSTIDSTDKAHPGQMDIQSEPRNGTLVSLRLVASEGMIQADAPISLPGTGSAQGTLKVIVVDDDELILSSMQTLLETLGHAVITRQSGEDAMATIEAGFEPDVVILDMNIPGLGGAGTLTHLRAALPDLPVLLATGRADQTTVDLINLYPGVNLLPKPFNMEALQQQLVGLVRN